MGKPFRILGFERRLTRQARLSSSGLRPPFQFDARVEVDKPGHHAATAVIRKALDPHRISVTLRPVKDELKSDVEFEDPGLE